MLKIAALYTCHNRKLKTLKSLNSLFKAYNNIATEKFILDVYITDDGSTDGTSEAIKNEFPNVHVIHGNGNLFWAEGMRSSWKEALKGNYDAYLLLNDDVELYDNVFSELMKADTYCKKVSGKGGVYLGATEDKNLGKLTYSGSVITNKFLYLSERLAPNGEFQSCDLGNANIMMVDKCVVKSIGILTEGYSHGMADYDYTLSARRENIEVIIAPNYCGHCVNDHTDHYEGFAEKTLQERKKVLNSPTGLAFDSYKRYMKKFFPLRYPLVAFFGWLKLYFPKLYLKCFRK